MIEINPKEAEWMWVRNLKNETKVKRLVVAKIKNRYIAIEKGYEKEFLILDDDTPVYLKTWKYAEPIKEVLSAVAKSAEEITGIKGITYFTYISDDEKYWTYTKEMNKLAGRRIRLRPSDIYWYDYISEDGHYWSKNWLKDFRKEE